MNLVGKITAIVLVLLGVGWLVSLFGLSLVGNRAMNQIRPSESPSLAESPLPPDTSQSPSVAVGRFNVPRSPATSSQTAQVPSTVTMPTTTPSSPVASQPTSSPSPSTAVTPSPRPATPALVTPTPTVTSQPIRAGW